MNNIQYTYIMSMFEIWIRMDPHVLRPLDLDPHFLFANPWIRIRIFCLPIHRFGSAFFVCGSMASFLSESDTTGFFGSDWFQTGSVSRIQFTIPDPKHCYNIVLAFKMLLTPRYLCFHKLLRSRKTVESVSEPRVYTIHISIH